MEVVQVIKIEPNVAISVQKLLMPAFNESFDKLKKVVTFSGEVTFKIRRLGKKIEKELEVYNEVRLETLKACAKKDDSGSPIVGQDPRGFDTYALLDEKKKEFNEKVTGLQGVMVELEKIKYNDLGANHGLSAHDLIQLDFIVE